MHKITRALVSVSDKTGVTELGRALAARGIEILSTGGTARALAEAGVPVVEVADYTGFPEMMAGRLKTLHPRIHGGILGRRGTDDEDMAAHDIGPIDLVVVNLYPFEATVARPDCDLATAIENIDIGGPALIRAAAKNHAAVAVAVDPADYADLIEELETNDAALSPATRYRLATKAYAHTAAYDAAIAYYLETRAEGAEAVPLPEHLVVAYERRQRMRYGENPHQRAAFYVERDPGEPCLASARQLQGKELSYNNVADADAALACVRGFDEAPACVIVKHANPCGVALGHDVREAYERAYATDPTSAFGGIIAFNRPLDADTAQAIIERQFVEVIIAPEVEAEAAGVLAAKKNVRVLATGTWDGPPRAGLDFKRVTGGLLVQDRDLGMVAQGQLKVVSQTRPSEAELDDLLFTWRVVKYVKSNAIVYARDRQTVGIGAGQMSRVYSARIAAIKAADEALSLRGSVMASDAFFPFRDGVDQAAEVGVTAIIQPGGSMRDEEVIAAADEHGIAMVFTGMRHFRH